VGPGCDPDLPGYGNEGPQIPLDNPTCQILSDHLEVRPESEELQEEERDQLLLGWIGGNLQ
jgi:hypothetical protein